MRTWINRLLWLFAAALAAVASVFIAKEMGERKMQRVIAVTLGAAADDRVRRHAQAGPLPVRHARLRRLPRRQWRRARSHPQQPSMLVTSPNITAGANSATAGYRDIDWVRTLRHGVKPDGRPVMIMPSEDYNRLTDNDLASIIGYVRQMPWRPGGPRRLSCLSESHSDVRVRRRERRGRTDRPYAGAAVAGGGGGERGPRRLRGAQLRGLPRRAPERWPHSRFAARVAWQPANLTPGPGSAMARYPSADTFMAMLRSGQRPDGSTISSVMPFGSLRQMNETDMRALHAYLRTLEPRTSRRTVNGQRTRRIDEIWLSRLPRRS
ncbi:hypothetical protein LP419_08250 [Massilia sp. H-1]|nr:hypothetical protein LP419_08250 [Massilia sp. H-1]